MNLAETMLWLAIAGGGITVVAKLILAVVRRRDASVNEEVRDVR